MPHEITDLQSSLSENDGAIERSKETQDDRLRKYIVRSKSGNTVRAYQSDWFDFDQWCRMNGELSLPASPRTIANYMVQLAERGLRLSTVQRRLTSIGLAHEATGFGVSTGHAEVRAVWRGLRKTFGTRQEQKQPVLVEDLRRMVEAAPMTLHGLRDRALLLLGFAGAFRRSELISVDVDDLLFSREGLTVTLRRSKTDQSGEGRKIGIPYGSRLETCPVRTLDEWLETAKLTSGPVFRRISAMGRIGETRLSDKTVARVVKCYVEAVGLDPSLYAGHSLRAGLATSAAMAGAGERSIMNQTGHRSTTMVRRYIRDGNLFRDNAASYVGL